MIHIGQKIWIDEDRRGRVIDILGSSVIVQEDYRWRVDGTKDTPIYQYRRNPNGEKHIISKENEC
jgi:hypothetical protein